MMHTYGIHILTAPGLFRTEKADLQGFFESLNPHANPDGIKVVVYTEEHPDCDPNHIVVYHPDHAPLVLQSADCDAPQYTPLHYTYDHMVTAIFYAMLYARLTVLTDLALDVKEGQYRWGGYPLRSLDTAQPLTHRMDDSDEARSTILYACLKEMQGRMTVGVNRLRILSFLRFVKGGIGGAVAALNRYVRRLEYGESLIDVRRIVESHYLAALMLACDTQQQARHITMMQHITKVLPYLPHKDAIAAVVDLGRYLREKEQAEILLAVIDAMSFLCKDAWYQFESLYQYARNATKGPDYFSTAQHMGSVLWNANPDKGAPYYLDVCAAYIEYAQHADVSHPRAVSETMEKMAEIYESIRDFDSAVTARTAVYEQYCEQYGELFDTSVAALRELAMTHYRGGDLEAACRLWEELYSQQCMIYGDEDTQPAISLAWLSRICHQRNNRQQQLHWLNKLHANYTANYGIEDTHTLDVLLMRAEILRDLGQIDEARTMCEESYVHVRAICGEEHPSTVRIRDFLQSLTETE